MADPLFPRRSIVAGCTWATFHVRVMLISPLDRFANKLIQQAAIWQATVRLALYIDDGMVMTTGSRGAVAMVHAWASRMLIQFLTSTLKKPIADDKLTCCASSCGLRDDLRAGLGGDGFRVELVGGLLGVDLSLGRPAAKRPLDLGRFAKAFRRKKRLKWLRANRGDAKYVVKSGLTRSVAYGTAATGLRPSRLRDLRRIQGSVTRVRGGGSLTARLALGGDNFSDIDPSTFLLVPPPLYLTKLVWDLPQARHGFILAWKRANEIMKDLPPSSAGARWLALSARHSPNSARWERSGPTLSKFASYIMSSTSWKFPPLNSARFFVHTSVASSIANWSSGWPWSMPGTWS